MIRSTTEALLQAASIVLFVLRIFRLGLGFRSSGSKYLGRNVLRKSSASAKAAAGVSEGGLLGLSTAGAKVRRAFARCAGGSGEALDPGTALKSLELAGSVTGGSSLSHPLKSAGSVSGGVGTISAGDAIGH